MLRKLIECVGVICVLVTGACRHAPPDPIDARRMLTGHWELRLGNDCKDYGIQSDMLVLHSDGRLEQHFVSSSGARYDASEGHWSYVPDNSVSFDARRNFFSKQPSTGTIGVSVHETLIVEFGSPSIILLNPDSDCFYRKIGDRD